MFGFSKEKSNNSSMSEISSTNNSTIRKKEILEFLSKKERCCICGNCYPTAKLAHFTLGKKKRHDFQSPDNISKYYSQYSEKLDLDLRVPTLYCDITKKLPARHEFKKEIESVCKEYIIKSIPFKTHKKFFCKECLAARIQQIYSCVDTFLEYVQDNKISNKKDILTINTNEITKKTKKSLQKEAGVRGENLVDFELKWLSKDYISINKDCKSRYNEQCILISNEEYLDGITQEIDHIVVSAKGVFVIETKNMSGTLFVDEQGNWSRTVEGQATGIPSPVSQINKHCKVLQSFLDDVPLVKVICIANSSSIITSNHNSDYYIVKYDCICDFIETFIPNNHESVKNIDITDVVNKINSHKVSTL